MTNEIKKGQKYTFNTHNADSELNHLTGNKVLVLRPLTDKECDISEVGNMYKIQFEDGAIIDCFEDELE